MDKAAQPANRACRADARTIRRTACCGCAAAILAVLTLACGSSSQTVTAPAQVRCAINAQVENATFPPDGGTGALRVTTARECTWSAQSDASWLVLTSGATGQGDGLVEFRVASNEAPAAREAGITINNSRQQISQQGRPCEFRLSSDHLIVTAEGGDRTIEVRANSQQCTWTAAANAPWITIVNGREGSGDGAVTFTVAPAAGPPRTATMTIAGETVRVEQGTGCSFTVTPSALSVTAAGGEQVIRVDATSPECSWTATAHAPWVTIADGTGGTGTGLVTVRVDATDGPPRSTTLTVAGQPVSVNQGTGCTVSVSPTSASVPAPGGTIGVAVESGPGCSWTAATGQSWISITSGALGSGAGRVDVTVAANPGPARSGGVSIGGQVFAISQASGCTYTISPTTQDIAGASTSGGVTVATGAGCSWTASTGDAWITLSQTSGTGPGELRYTTATNASPSRSGTITVAGHTFTLNQASLCTYVLAPPFHEFDAGGGNGNVLVIVSGPCTWTATSDASWIQMTAGLSGTGSGLVQFSVQPNPGPPRTGFVIIAGQQYRVSQGGR